MEVRSSGGEHVPEFEDIQKALFEARSQFSYPLQRLLDQNCQMERIELVEAASTPHLMSHSQSTQSHAGSDNQFKPTPSHPTVDYSKLNQSMYRVIIIM